MTTPKHTPGPFTVEKIERGKYAISAPHWFQMATVSHVELPLDDPEGIADMEAQSAGNAALLGASLDLFEALRYGLDLYGPNHDGPWPVEKRREFDRLAQAALRRALGQ